MTKQPPMKRDYLFAILPEQLLLDQRISPRAMQMWALLLRVAQRGQMPERKWIAEQLGCDLSTVQRSLRELIDTGWIARTSRGRTNHYELVSTPEWAADKPGLFDRGPIPFPGGTLVDQWVKNRKMQSAATSDTQAVTDTTEAAMESRDAVTGDSSARSDNAGEVRELESLESTTVSRPSGAAKREPIQVNREPTRPKSGKRAMRAVEEENFGEGAVRRPETEDSPPDASVCVDPLAPGSHPIPRMSAAGLAAYFQQSARRRLPAEARIFGAFNDHALAKNIAAWRREGADTAVIKRMIDAYLGESPPVGVPLWKGFVAARARLAAGAAAGIASDLNEQYDMRRNPAFNGGLGAQRERQRTDRRTSCA